LILARLETETTPTHGAVVRAWACCGALRCQRACVFVFGQSSRHVMVNAPSDLSVAGGVIGRALAARSTDDTTTNHCIDSRPLSAIH
jgi:hypothetical protein